MTCDDVLFHTSQHHGLPLLFAALAVESFGIPVPGETALITFGVLASQGHYGVTAARHPG
jgi:membrane protein DedA with SNARE-associated domain